MPINQSKILYRLSTLDKTNHLNYIDKHNYTIIQNYLSVFYKIQLHISYINIVFLSNPTSQFHFVNFITVLCLVFLFLTYKHKNKKVMLMFITTNMSHINYGFDKKMSNIFQPKSVHLKHI